MCCSAALLTEAQRSTVASAAVGRCFSEVLCYVVRVKTALGRNDVFGELFVESMA